MTKANQSRREKWQQRKETKKEKEREARKITKKGGRNSSKPTGGTKHNTKGNASSGGSGSGFGPRDNSIKSQQQQQQLQNGPSDPTAKVPSGNRKEKSKINLSKGWKKSRLDCETTKAATLIAAGGAGCQGLQRDAQLRQPRQLPSCSKQISAPAKLQKLLYYRFNYRLTIVMGLKVWNMLGECLKVINNENEMEIVCSLQHLSWFDWQYYRLNYRLTV